MQIGNWIRRVRGKWHLIESVVDGDAVTRCGRRMGPTTGQGMLMFSDVMPLTRMPKQPQLCKAGCERADEDRPGWENGVFVGERVAVTGGIQVVEDDPSTSPVDPVTGMP